MADQFSTTQTTTRPWTEPINELFQSVMAFAQMRRIMEEQRRGQKRDVEQRKQDVLLKLAPIFSGAPVALADLLKEATGIDVPFVHTKEEAEEIAAAPIEGRFGKPMEAIPGFAEMSPLEKKQAIRELRKTKLPPEQRPTAFRTAQEKAELKQREVMETFAGKEVIKAQIQAEVKERQAELDIGKAIEIHKAKQTPLERIEYQLDQRLMNKGFSPEERAQKLGDFRGRINQLEKGPAPVKLSFTAQTVRSAIAQALKTKTGTVQAQIPFEDLVAGRVPAMASLSGEELSNTLEPFLNELNIIEAQRGTLLPQEQIILHFIRQIIRNQGE
tara:strand:+ start:3308 stop:4294 length:987 start_codon:yes stop_codon:yes gene_type:complete